MEGIKKEEEEYFDDYVAAEDKKQMNYLPESQQCCRHSTTSSLPLRYTHIVSVSRSDGRVKKPVSNIKYMPCCCPRNSKV